MKADLAKEMQESEVEEKHDQEEYEEMTADAAEKRKADSASIDEKTGVKADAEAALVTHESEKKARVRPCRTTSTSTTFIKIATG